MNSEILNQEGLDESLAEYIRSNVPATEVEEVIEDSNEEVEVSEVETEEIIGETEVVEEPTIEDVVFDENEDIIEE